ncbi:hypothetical protein [Pannonibacter phragmitetus]|uniref:hypothetical protein n=1 Tax=Pannonibacter phragmitetus TaxID=121719 RepID=UPI001FFD018D|nr:hypothetical protein [Pannonibacter phragmitetus]
MPKFVVSKGHDAFAYYETVVEADTPEQARGRAESVYYDGEWLATGYVQEFDDYEIDEYSGVRLLEDGETVEAFVSLAVTAQERDAVLAGLRLLQLTLARADIDPALGSIVTKSLQRKAGHFEILLGLLKMLLADIQAVRPSSDQWIEHAIWAVARGEAILAGARDPDRPAYDDSARAVDSEAQAPAGDNAGGGQ